jgi:hypothetical protein
MIRIIITSVLASYLNVAFASKGECDTEVRVSLVYVVDGEKYGTPGRLFVDGIEQTERANSSGIARLSLKDCTSNIIIRADPDISFLRDREMPCAAPLEIEAESIYTSNTVAALALRSGMTMVSDTNIEASYKIWRRAVETGDFGVAAKSASNLSIGLVSYDESTAQAFSVLAMDAGYRALGIEPYSAPIKMINYDPSQKIYVMSPAGRELITKYQSGVGLGTEVPWSGRAFSRVAKNVKTFDSRALYSFQTRDAIATVSIDRAGRIQIPN